MAMDKVNPQKDTAAPAERHRMGEPFRTLTTLSHDSLGRVLVERQHWATLDGMAHRCPVCNGVLVPQEWQRKTCITCGRVWRVYHEDHRVDWNTGVVDAGSPIHTSSMDNRDAYEKYMSGKLPLMQGSSGAAYTV